MRGDKATIEHLNRLGPFYWAEGLKEKELVICCGLSRDNQGGKRDNQDGKFFEGAFFEPFGSDLTHLEAI
jgi:hypothetical protein